MGFSASFLLLCEICLWEVFCCLSGKSFINELQLRTSTKDQIYCYLKYSRPYLWTILTTTEKKTFCISTQLLIYDSIDASPRSLAINGCVISVPKAQSEAFWVIKHCFNFVLYTLVATHKKLNRSLPSLVRFFMLRNSWIKIVRAHFPWSNLYLLQTNDL